MNEKQIEIVKSITDKMVSDFHDLLYADETSQHIGNKYLEVVASILSSVNLTIINGWSRDVSEGDAVHFKEAIIEISKVIIKDIMRVTEEKIKKAEMH